MLGGAVNIETSYRSNNRMVRISTVDDLSLIEQDGFGFHGQIRYHLQQSQDVRCGNGFAQ
jgi:hypothetical protein